MRKERQYMIFTLVDGALVGNLTWELAKELHGSSPEWYRAVFMQGGKPRVRFLCSGLVASAQESREELDGINSLRKKFGRCQSPWYGRVSE